MKINKYKKQVSFGLAQDLRGFTLIEVLLVVTIFTIILSSAISLTGKQVFENDLIAKSLEVSDIIERARNYSATGFRGDVWSIKVLDSNALCKDSGDCVLLFKGRSFDSRETQYDRFVEFDQDITGVYINANQSNEFYFAYKSGWLATSTASFLEQQHIVLDSNFGKQKSIVVQSSGVVAVFTCGEDKLFDVEGTGYLTIKIGTQCWMGENLNTGTMLASAATTPSDNDSIEKWCYDSSEINCTNNGGLYDWDELMEYETTNGGQGICPAGWHVPTGNAEGSELDILEDNYPSATNATELLIGGSSGFHLPFGGERSSANIFDASDYAILWSSTINSSAPTEAYIHYVQDPATSMSKTSNAQNYGFSVRCLKDY